ncbi:MAG: transposase [Nitrospiraceae bacterium]
MQIKLRRGGNRSRYRLRAQTMDPASGQIKQVREFRQMPFRGLAHAAQEWISVCMARNFLKLPEVLA